MTLSQEIKPEDLGVDVEAGYVDGFYVGEVMAQVALRVRRKHARFYLDRADPWARVPEQEPMQASEPD